MTAVTPDLDRLAIDTIRTLSIDGVQQANSGHPGAPMGAAPMAYVAVDALPPPRPDPPGLAGPRPLRALAPGHAEHAAVLAPPPDRLRPLARRPQDVPPVGQPDARPPGVRPDAGRRGDDRPARPGLRPTRSGWPSPSGVWRPSSTATGTTRRPLDLRHRLGRRPPGGHRLGGVRASPATSGSASSSSSTTTTTSSSTGRPRWPGRRTSSRASRPTAGTPSGSRTATTSTAIEAAIEAARADDRPSLIAVRTHIGFGSPNKQDTQKAHGAPLGPDEVRLIKEAYGWDPDKTFYVPDDALAVFRDAVPDGERLVADWEARFDAYATAHPDLAAEFRPPDRRRAAPTAGTPTSRPTRPGPRSRPATPARTRSRRSRRACPSCSAGPPTCPSRT